MAQYFVALAWLCEISVITARYIKVSACHVVMRYSK